MHAQPPALRAAVLLLGILLVGAGCAAEPAQAPASPPGAAAPSTNAALAPGSTAVALATSAPPAAQAPAPAAATALHGTTPPPNTLPTPGFPPASATPTFPEAKIDDQSIGALRLLRTVGFGQPHSLKIGLGGRHLAVGTSSGIALFELPTLRLIRFDPAADSASPTSNDREQQAQMLAALCQGGTECLAALAAAQQTTLPAAFSGSGTIISPDMHLAAIPETKPDEAGQTQIRRIDDGTLLYTLPGTLPAFSHDGSMLAISDGSRVRVWQRQALEAGNDQPGATFAPPNVEAQTWGNALAFSPDAQALHAVLGGDLFSWRISDGLLRWKLPDVAAESVEFRMHGAVLETIAAGGDAPSGTRVIRTSDGTEVYSGWVGNIAFGSDDVTVALIPFATDGPVEVIDIASGAINAFRMPDYQALAFSPDALTLAAATSHGIDLVDVIDSRVQERISADLIALFDLHIQNNLQYSRDGQLLMYQKQGENLYDGVSASAQSWKLAPAIQLRSAQRSKPKNRTREADLLLAAFSPDTGAAAYSYDRTHVEIQPPNAPAFTLTMPISVTAMVFNPAGDVLALGNEAGTIRMVGLPDGGETGQLAAGGPTHGLVFSQDGTLLAGMRDDGSALVWQLGKQVPVATLSGIRENSTVIFSADKQLLIAGGPNGVAFYRIADGSLLRLIAVAAEDIALGPHQRMLAILHNMQIQLWGIPS